MQNIAIFLSGTGSNARAICAYFQNHPQISVGLLLSNKENSGVKNIGEAYNIPYIIINKDESRNPEVMLPELNQHHITTIVLAGFLWLIPEYLLDAFPNKIINIHPALLPKYGGKGMHGIHVHEAVYKNKEKESGITIHLCNKEYDKGEILFQKSVPLSEHETPDSIAKAVLNLEHQFYPVAIETFLLPHHNNL